MNIDLPSDFNYSPSFLRVIIPGLSFTISVIIAPLSIYLYFNNYLLLFKIINSDKFSLSVAIISISILIGILINSIERPLIQFLEGYSLKDFLPKSVFSKMQIYQYKESIKLIEERNNLVTSTGLKSNIQKDRLYDDIYNYYSIYLYYIYHANLDEEEVTSSLMPTTLGNIFRSIEVYPNWKYGMDGVFFWHRLKSYISEQESIDLDERYAFVNMYTYLSLIFGLSYFIFEILSIFSMGKILAIIFSVIALIFLFLSILCYNILLDSAVLYGHSVRSMFDLHRKELLDKFNLKTMNIDPKSEEKEIWRSIKEYLYYPTD
ncbi:MAG: hypothetical protein O8C63_06470 [Candidatus Methanoperedens sp.]|nr:hypothetical protein [Candidatus Methanoperedens sp.]